MTDVIDIATVPGIAAIVWAIVELFAAPVSRAWKPPLVGVLAISWAMAAHISLAAFSDPLTAIAAGVAAGSMAITAAALRTNYRV